MKKPFERFNLKKGKDELLFDDFSMEIEPGTVNAIVGPSGFGKTTLMNLIMRIFEPIEGKITLDDKDLTDLKFDSFRKHIAVIP